MTVEQHTRGNEIAKDIETLNTHKSQVQRIATHNGKDPDGMYFRLRFYRYDYDHADAKPELLPIPLNTFKTLYLAAIDAKIKALETEFANL